MPVCPLSVTQHQKSKMRQIYFQFHTMGFRGEAPALIAAVAQVEPRTRRENEELGTLIEIA